MRLHGTMAINGKGHLTVGGCDTVDLAENFGTPLYIMDEAYIREVCGQYRETYIEPYPGNEVLYAAKAFLTMAMVRVVAQEGLGLDVVSGGELYTALQAGFDPARICFHGNNKSREEIYAGVRANVGRIMVDNPAELDTLESVCAELGQTVSAVPRITPNVAAHTHEYVQTGQLDSKFGQAIATGQAMDLIQKIIQSKHVRLKGVHCHIGSQIFEIEAFRLAVQNMVAFVSEVREKTGVALEELNLGGGFGIYYTEGDDPQPIQSFARSIMDAVRQETGKYGLPVPRVVIEPGRSIVGAAGITLYRVGDVKVIPDVRVYVAVDGGMTDNPRYALYQAKYEAALANRMNDPLTVTASIAGKCCESGDMVARDVQLPGVAPGDLLTVFSTGAYNYSMSSNYNRLPKPAVVLVNGGKADIIVKRETPEDIIRNDVVPDRLR
ncbi:MAG: diaminopimelate decarboxylase [Peptococcaceae bacterium]|nr:diaminopimelate decarboxylase [Peptococcaceae bacterium]